MTLYGFFFNYCVYESSDRLESLHKSEANAIAAMNAHKKDYVDSYEWETWKVIPIEVME